MLSNNGGQIAAVNAQALAPLWSGALLVLLALAAWQSGRRGMPAVVNLALLGAAMPALLQIAGMRAFGSYYDIKPMALAIKQVYRGSAVVLVDA